MTGVREVVRREFSQEKITGDKWGSYQGMWVVARAVMFDDGTSSLRLSLQSKNSAVLEIVPEKVSSEVLSDGESAAARYQGANMSDITKLTLTAEEILHTVDSKYYELDALFSTFALSMLPKLVLNNRS